MVRGMGEVYIVEVFDVNLVEGWKNLVSCYYCLGVILVKVLP